MGGGEERSGVDGWGVGRVGERERDGCPDRIINAAGATCLAKLLQLQLRLGYTHVTTRRVRDKRMPSSIDGRSIIGKRQQEMRSLGRDGYRGRERGGGRGYRRQV